MLSAGASICCIAALGMMWATPLAPLDFADALESGPVVGRREILRVVGGGALAIASAPDPASAGTAGGSGFSNPNGTYDEDELRRIFRTLRSAEAKPGRTPSPSPQTIAWTPPSEEFSGLRYGSSSLSSKEAIVPKPKRDALPNLPSWMEGHWLVTYRFDRVSFPNGRDRMSLAVPGAGLGTCAILPNVGANPSSFVQRFGSGRHPLGSEPSDEGDAVVEDVAYNHPRRFEGFWPDAKVSSVAVRTSPTTAALGPACLVTGEGCSPAANPDLHGRHATRCRMEFAGPTRRSGRITQHLDVSMVDWTTTTAAAGGSRDDDGDDDEFLMARSFVQQNLEQELTTYYREFVSYERQPRTAKLPNGAVRGRTCIAAFLPPFEQPVALYSYSLKMHAITDEEALAY